MRSAVFFSEDDIAEIKALLEPDCSEALVLFEHTWAAALRQAVVNANGRWLTGDLIPRALVEQCARVGIERPHESEVGRLAQLKDSGALTAQEFEREKAKLLSN